MGAWSPVISVEAGANFPGGDRWVCGSVVDYDLARDAWVPIPFPRPAVSIMVAG
jgi:hypothetical protein